MDQLAKYDEKCDCFFADNYVELEEFGIKAYCEECQKCKKY